MVLKRTVAAFFLAMALATAGFAQSAATPADEYGRVSDGAIDLITKRAQPFSGSLSITSSQHSLGSGFGGTIGGTVVPDRVWFFAAAEKSQPLIASRFGLDQAVARGLDAKMITQLGDRQSLAASFAASRRPLVFSTIPTTFLNLHYTGIVTDNMFVTGSISESKR